jgi:hypothetical protein
MKANELRIGNYVTDNYNNIVEIESIWGKLMVSFNTLSDKTLSTRFPTKHLNPIPLTEEWLIKFGFNKKTGIFSKNINEQVIAIGLDGSYGLYNDEIDWREGSSFCGDNRIIYVHQLQNLYFALTNEEL